MTAEPSTLTIHDNPARIFYVANEAQIIAEIEVEYRGGGWWRAQLDTGAPRREEYSASRSLSWVQRWAAATMEEQAEKARADCAKICGTDGEDTSGNGTFACGVMSPHGISITVSDGDGNDLTQDYLINGM
jgi:hypothetical protein